MKILYGSNISPKFYDKIADFDAEIFPSNSDEFVHDAEVPRENMISILEKNTETTVIILDDDENIIAYFQAFPLLPEFEAEFLKNELSFNTLDGSKIMSPDCNNISLYVLSTGIKKEYRELKILNSNNGNTKLPLILLLHEGLIDALIDLIKTGVTINNVFGNAISKKGVRVMEGLCGKDSLIYKNDDEYLFSYYGKFDYNCEGFSRCRNLNELKNLLNKQNLIN